jgi:hypothetical protein
MEDFVTFEIAKKLKEKGFPQVTFGNYNMQSACYIEDGRFYENGCITEVSRAYTAPTIYQTLKWLREEKGLHIEIIANSDGYWYIVSHTPRRGCSNLYRCYDGGTNDAGEWDDYEECTLSAIEYVLENLI